MTGYLLGQLRNEYAQPQKAALRVGDVVFAAMRPDYDEAAEREAYMDTRARLDAMFKAFVTGRAIVASNEIQRYHTETVNLHSPVAVLPADVGIVLGAYPYEKLVTREHLPADEADERGEPELHEYGWALSQLSPRAMLRTAQLARPWDYGAYDSHVVLLDQVVHPDLQMHINPAVTQNLERIVDFTHDMIELSLNQ